MFITHKSPDRRLHTQRHKAKQRRNEMRFVEVNVSPRCRGSDTEHTHGLSRSVYELLSCVLSAAKAELLHEKVFIAAEPPLSHIPATARLAAPGQARPFTLPSPARDHRLMKSPTDRLTR